MDDLTRDVLEEFVAAAGIPTVRRREVVRFVKRARWKGPIITCETCRQRKHVALWRRRQGRWCSQRCQWLACRPKV